MEYQFYKTYYKRSIWIGLIIGILTGIVCFLSTFLFEDFIREQFNIIANNVVGDNKGELSNVQTFYSVITNNLLIGAMVLLIGFIPIYGLPYIFGLLSFASVGIIAGYGMITGHNVWLTMLVAFVPHAIIEIIPILYSIAVGMYINRNVSKKIFFRKKKESETFKNLFIHGVSSYMMIIVPTFLLAALVEAFITPRISDMFL